MKRHEIYKTIQLICYLALAAVGIGIVFLDRDVYHRVIADPVLMILCALLWLALLIGFIFIYLDLRYFFQYKKEYIELRYAVHSDPVSGINNRFSCDMIIEKYLDQPLPENMGCMMIDLTNVGEINRKFGHVRGNELIRDFSEILNDASKDLCFVGRNGGNKFLALFEDTTKEAMDEFVDRIDRKTRGYNEITGDILMEYRCGRAFQEEGIEQITQLIALSNQRINHDDQAER